MRFFLDKREIPPRIKEFRQAYQSWFDTYVHE